MPEDEYQTSARRLSKNDEPPEMDAHAEEPADALDAELFSGAIFEQPAAVERLEWYIARWQRRLSEIKASQSEEG